jgi:Large ribosomal RNA subunit accumulation protein YceD
MKTSTESPVSFLANVARLPQKGMPVVIEADARQRAKLAEEHGLVSVRRYRADLLVTAWKRNGVKVSGTVDADIVQECVITLEPLDSRICEEVSAVFLPEDSKLGRQGFHTGGEILLDAEGPDSPETFSADTIDVGALAEEFFELAIDPYPRKPGADLNLAADDADLPDSPFARLSALKKSS